MREHVTIEVIERARCWLYGMLLYIWRRVQTETSPGQPAERGGPIIHAHDEVVNHASKHLKLDLEGVEGMSHENERVAGRSACPVRIP